MKKETEERIKDFIDITFEAAEQNINNDDNTPLFSQAVLALAEDKGYVIMIPWSNETKLKLLEEVGMECFDKKAYQVALISDAAMKTYTRPVLDETEVPLAYPASMRKDCLMLMYVDFMDPKENMCRSYPYKKIDKKLVREPELGAEYGKITSHLNQAMALGFMKAAMLEEVKLQEITEFSQENAAIVYKAMLAKYPGASLGDLPDGASNEH